MQPDLEVAELTGRLDELWQPERESVEADDEQEIQAPSNQTTGFPSAFRRLGACPAVGCTRSASSVASSQSRSSEAASAHRAGDPARAEHEHAHDDRRNALEEEEPLPSLHPEQAVEPEQRTGDRPPEDPGDRDRREEPGVGPRTLARRDTNRSDRR